MTISFAALGAAMVGQDALAQVNADRGRNESVRDRSRPEFDALGARLGAFEFRPELELGVETSDNVFASQQFAESDTILSANPRAALRSTWSRHLLRFSADVKRSEYQDFDSESRTDALADVEGRLDISRAASIGLGASYRDQAEPRYDLGSRDRLAPLETFQDTAVYAQGLVELARVRLSARAGRSEQEFDIDTNRDRTETFGRLRAEYAISPDTALVAQVDVDQREFDGPRPAGLPPGAPVIRPDSDGREYLIGFNTDLSRVARGEITVGVLERDYESDTLRDVDGLAFNATVEWFPTQITTVTLDGYRRSEDLGFVGNSGYVAQRIGGRVDHELRRNVILNGGVRFGTDEQTETDRTDDLLEAQAGVTWLVNRRLGVKAGYTHRKVDGNAFTGGVKREFDINGFSLSTTFKL